MRRSGLIVKISSKVSIHASVKDATRHIVKLKRAIYCFNPRICKRCDQLEFHVLDFPHVSIHASVKDATTLFKVDLVNCVVSIHASVKDATNIFLKVLPLDKFQSTHL